MSGAPGLSIRWAVALLVAAKELRDTLRDRRTLLMMVLVPMLLYPLGGIVVAQRGWHRGVVGISAARLVERMEAEGIVSAPMGSKGREVLARSYGTEE